MGGRVQKTEGLQLISPIELSLHPFESLHWICSHLTRFEQRNRKNIHTYAHAWVFYFPKKKIMKKMLKYQHSLTAPMFTLEWYLTPKESHWSHSPLIWVKLLVLSYSARVVKWILSVRSNASFVGGSLSTHGLCQDLFLKDKPIILQCQWEIPAFSCPLLPAGYWDGFLTQRGIRLTLLVRL